MSQSIVEFATIILYVTIGFCLLVSLLGKDRSFKTVDRGTLFIFADPLLKIQMFILCLSFGVITLSSPNVAKYNKLYWRDNQKEMTIEPERSKI